MYIKLRGLFTPQAVARRMRDLPIIRTTIMDLIYPRRPQRALPVIGVEELRSVAKAQPLVRRGAPSLALGDNSLGVDFVEPLPVSLHVDVTGAELNNLQMLDPAGLETWASERTDFLRRSCRATTEAIAAVSLGGKITWPVKLEGGGFTSWEYDFGAPLTHVQTTKFADGGAKLSTAHACLNSMSEMIEDNGYGSELVILAGRDAYNALYALAEGTTSTAKLRVEVKDHEIVVGGYTVRRCSEKYLNPETGAMVDKIPTKKLCMVATDAAPALFYAALDDLDAKLQPMPFFAKPEKITGTGQSGYRIFGMSKPLPAPVPKATCWAEVLA